MRGICAVSTCLVCLVTSAAVAQPTLYIAGGNLVIGKRIWTVYVNPNATNTRLSFELGFRTSIDGGGFLSIDPNPNAPMPGTTPIEMLTPGDPIFGWETVTPPPTGTDKPEGIQIGPPANAVRRQAFVAVKTNMLATPADYEILTIRTDPNADSLELGGIFHADGTMGTPGIDFLTGQITQENLDGGIDHFYGYRVSLMFACDIPGDFDGSCAVGSGDLHLVLDNWIDTLPPYPTGWTGDQPDLGNSVGVAYLNRVLDNWGNTAAEGVNVTSIPEPTAATLLLLAMIRSAGIRNRG